MSAIEDMLLKFTSGNDVAVQRAVVSLDEWRAIYAEYMALKQERDELAAKCADFIDTAQQAYDYWNGDYNDQAMSNALDTIMELLVSIVGDPPEKLLLARIKAAAVREAWNQVEVPHVTETNQTEDWESGFDAATDLIGFSIEAYANQIEGGA